MLWLPMPEPYSTQELPHITAAANRRRVDESIPTAMTATASIPAETRERERGKKAERSVPWRPVDDLRRS